MTMSVRELRMVARDGLAVVAIQRRLSVCSSLMASLRREILPSDWRYLR